MTHWNVRANPMRMETWLEFGSRLSEIQVALFLWPQYQNLVKTSLWSDGFEFSTWLTWVSDWAKLSLWHDWFWFPSLLKNEFRGHLGRTNQYFRYSSTIVEGVLGCLSSRPVKLLMMIWLLHPNPGLANARDYILHDIFIGRICTLFRC